MPAVNDTYRVKLFTSALGQNFLNVFHYQATLSSGSANDFANRFRLSVWQPVANCLSSETAYDHIEVSNLDDPTDFVSWIGVVYNGQRSGVSLSPHDTLSFTYLSSRTDVKDGGKRFSTVAASDISDGQPTSSLLSLIAIAEDALESAIAGASAIYRPRIWGKRKGSLGNLDYPNPIDGVNFIGQYTQNTRNSYTSPGW